MGLSDKEAEALFAQIGALQRLVIELAEHTQDAVNMYNARIARLEDAVVELGVVLPDLEVLEDILTKAEFRRITEGLDEDGDEDE